MAFVRDKGHRATKLCSSHGARNLILQGRFDSDSHPSHSDARRDISAPRDAGCSTGRSGLKGRWSKQTRGS